MKVTDNSEGGTWGHWWTEVGKRNPVTDEVEAEEDPQGGGPRHGAGGAAGGALAGVDGKLEQGRAASTTRTRATRASRGSPSSTRR